MTSAAAAKAHMVEDAGEPLLDARCVYVADLREYVAGVDPQATRARRMGITGSSLRLASRAVRTEQSAEHSL